MDSAITASNDAQLAPVLRGLPRNEAGFEITVSAAELLRDAVGMRKPGERVKSQGRREFLRKATWFGIGAVATVVTLAVAGNIYLSTKNKPTQQPGTTETTNTQITFLDAVASRELRVQYLRQEFSENATMNDLRAEGIIGSAGDPGGEGFLYNPTSDQIDAALGALLSSKISDAAEVRSLIPQNEPSIAPDTLDAAIPSDINTMMGREVPEILVIEPQFFEGGTVNNEADAQAAFAAQGAAMKMGYSGLIAGFDVDYANSNAGLTAQFVGNIRELESWYAGLMYYFDNNIALGTQVNSDRMIAEMVIGYYDAYAAIEGYSANASEVPVRSAVLAQTGAITAELVGNSYKAHFNINGKTYTVTVTANQTTA